MVKGIIMGFLFMFSAVCFAVEPIDARGYNYSKKKPLEKHDRLPRGRPGQYPSAYKRNMKENRPPLPTNTQSQIKYKRR